MVSFLALLPRTLTTFLYAVAALLRFYADTDTTPIQLIPLTILQWSFLAFALGTAALLANLGLEWHAGNRSRNREIEATERETRRDNLADEERNRATEEREKADQERARADQERDRADQERNRANQERNRADQERQRAARRARIQNRGFILQTRHQLTPNPDTEAALTDFLSFLQEYGE
ncbi:DUF874 family protein [Picosynechococcus sp. PCC 73109]|uniref:DUF874 family protein n=1 Tax=Picosynechococcus sp. PCC 73109 TaxID=374982 RepID=UPI0007458F0B|nr:DUF874 family protein [Picosynechococcus sp. PCC 73109]AMA09222.1 hypothetical protein AWQ23_07775 [Picosynechococcus sp. PCC 73109]